MNGSTLARQPNPLPNPFRPGNGVPPYLAGRDRLLAAFEDRLIEDPPLHANWAMVGLRGTGKTVVLGEFAARGERAGWLTLHRELGDRHRDDRRLAEAIVEDCALMGRADALAAIGQAIDRGTRWLRPRRISVGEVGIEPSYEEMTSAPTDDMRRALAQLDATLSHSNRAARCSCSTRPICWRTIAAASAIRCRASGQLWPPCSASGRECGSCCAGCQP